MNMLARRLKSGNTVIFRYWSGTQDGRNHPAEKADFQLLKIEDNYGKELPLPLTEDDGGDGEYEKITEELLDILALENEYSRF